MKQARSDTAQSKIATVKFGGAATKPARPCALRAVLSGWLYDGRLRRDELNGDPVRPKIQIAI